MRSIYFFKRFSALLCAFVMVLGMFSFSTIYFASDFVEMPSMFFTDENISIPDEIASKYDCLVVQDCGSSYFLHCSNIPIVLECKDGVYGYRTWSINNCATNGTHYGYISNDGVNWTSRGISGYSVLTVKYEDENYVSNEITTVVSHYPIMRIKGQIVDENGDEIDDNPYDDYDRRLGYIQMTDYHIAYKRDALYNVIESSRTDRWTFKQYTTTNIDLTSGNYSINHYIQKVLCKNYEEDGVLEKYDKYFMGNYPASDLKIQYLCADYDKKMEDYGWNGIGFVDGLLGRFVLEYHIFELVDEDSGEVGGYVVYKPKDKDKTKFGVEYVGTTYTPDDEVDDDGFVEELIDYGLGTGDDIPDALENAEEDEDREIDKLDGVKSFSSVLNNLVNSVKKVSSVISKFFGCLPDWVLTAFTLSVGFGFLLFLIKVMR